LDRHLPRESDQQLSKAEALLADGNTAAAASLIEQAHATDPGSPRVILAYARLQAVRGDVKEAESLLATLTLDEQDKPEVAALRGQLHFADVAATAPPETELRESIAADDTNSEARYQLAARRLLMQDFEQALDQLFALMTKDRAYGDDAGRKGMLKVFAILGNDNELAKRYRSRMFNALH
jgi:putative thioredoxin